MIAPQQLPAVPLLHQPLDRSQDLQLLQPHFLAMPQMAHILGKLATMKQRHLQLLLPQYLKIMPQVSLKELDYSTSNGEQPMVMLMVAQSKPGVLKTLKLVRYS